MKRVHESLERALHRHRLILWYDPAQEWRETFESFAATGVEKLAVANNELATKVQIVRERNPGARFLVYIPVSKPADTENWLLDLLFQGHEFSADRASLDIEEVGLGFHLKQLAVDHASFFRSAKRVQALRELVKADDDARNVQLKMMAVLAGSPPELDALVLHYLAKGPEHGSDPVIEELSSVKLVSEFWSQVGSAFAYVAARPTLRDFAVSLFRAANPLDAQLGMNAHTRVFMQRWKDSQVHRASFEKWSRRLETELRIADSLEAAGDLAAIGEADTFEVFERFTLHRLSKAFQKGASASELREIIQGRRSSAWFTPHQYGYEAVEHAVDLREVLSATDLTVESFDAGLRKYVAGWWRIDAAYRRCVRALRCYSQGQVMAPISEWVEKAYVNNFLLPLADRWSDRVRLLETWQSGEIAMQRRFFDTYVAPFKAKNQKVFVIVSDALRYEAAAEFTATLRAANRWEAEIEAMLGVLPSYTQLGMASLLTGERLAVDPANGAVAVDGKSATGSENRSAILSSACGGRAVAVRAEAFLEMNTKTEGRALMRDHDVIYIFHNQIDHVGDKRDTEAKTFDAVVQTFEELEQIVKKVANVNGNNMLLTADHGFLFQQDPLDDSDMVPLPVAETLTCQNRRFAFGRGIQANPQVKIFPAASLAIGEGWSVALPLSLGRFPQSGSGKRYVHGGSSLQEVVIPVVRIRKVRSDDATEVEVDLLRVPTKITTGQISISLFQDRPAVDKARARTLRIGLFAKNGTLLSEQRTITFDSREEEARLRETSVLLALSRVADAFNNQDVELRLEETVAGTNQTVVYRRQDVRLQKPFTSDFDEF